MKPSCLQKDSVITITSMLKFHLILGKIKIRKSKTIGDTNHYEQSRIPE